MHAANGYESQHALGLLEEADEKSERLVAVFADKAYRGDLEDDLDEALGLRLEITASESDEPGFSVEPKRWIVERTLGWWRLAAALESARAVGRDERSNGPARFATIGL